MRRRSLVVLGMLMAMAMAMPVSANAEGSEGAVYGPNTHPLGVSYEAWTRRFARYLFEPPVAQQSSPGQPVATFQCVLGTRPQMQQPNAP